MSMSQYLNKDDYYADKIRYEQIKYECLIEAFKSALGTAETGNALVEVARKAHRAEQELAALKRKLTEEFEDEVDVNGHGWPNSAMRVMSILEGK